MKKIFILSILFFLVMPCFGDPCDEVKEIRILYSNSITVQGMRNPCATFEERFVDPDNIPTIKITEPEDVNIVIDGISEFIPYEKSVAEGPIVKILIDYGCRIDVLCVGYTYYATVNYNGKLMKSPENYAMDIVKLMKKYDPELITNEDIKKAREEGYEL